MAQPKNKIVRGVRASVLGFLGIVGLFAVAALVIGIVVGILWGVVSLISLIVGTQEWVTAALAILVVILFLSYIGFMIITLSRSIYLYGFRKGVKYWFEEQSV